MKRGERGVDDDMDVGQRSPGLIRGAVGTKVNSAILVLFSSPNESTASRESESFPTTLTVST